MKTALASIGLLLGLAAPAAAADLAPPVMPASSVVAPGRSWAGLYVGLAGGYAWGSTHQGWTSSTYRGLGTSVGDVDESLRANGGLIGATLGYNWQIDRVVLGLEADMSYASLKSRGSAPDAGIWSAGDSALQTWSTELTWLSTLRGRIGFTYDRFLVYGTGGLAIAGATDRTELTYNDGAGGGLSASARDSKTHLGWALGAGIEAALTEKLTAKLEYLHVDLGSQTYRSDLRLILIQADARFTADLVRAGLNYRF
jgi:outer membrane immunogenic protein